MKVILFTFTLHSNKSSPKQKRVDSTEIDSSLQCTMLINIGDNNVFLIHYVFLFRAMECAIELRDISPSIFCFFKVKKREWTYIKVTRKYLKVEYSRGKVLGACNRGRRNFLAKQIDSFSLQRRSDRIFGYAISIVEKRSFALQEFFCPENCHLRR